MVSMSSKRPGQRLGNRRRHEARAVGTSDARPVGGVRARRRERGRVVGSQRGTASPGRGRRSRRPAGAGSCASARRTTSTRSTPGTTSRAQGLNAMIMTYPLLVQIDYSNTEGYFISRRLGEVVEDVGGRQGLDVQAAPEHEVVGRQADDRRRRRVDDQHDDQVRGRGDRACRPRRSTTRRSARRRTRRRSSSTTTRRSANALWLSSRSSRSCRGTSGSRSRRSRRRQGAQDVPARRTTCRWSRAAPTRSSSTRRRARRVFIPDPNYYGPKSNADAVALTYYTNADSMIADLRQRQPRLDRPGAVQRRERGQEGARASRSTSGPAREITNITWNSNPRKLKNRELLDPRVKKALSMCVDRDKMIQVVFSGYATKVESLVGHISPLENPNLGPTKYNCAAANKALDELGYKRGSDGIRVAPATTRQVRAGRTSDELRDHHADLDRLQRRPDVRDRQGGLREARRQGHAEGRRRLDRERTRSRPTRSATPRRASATRSSTSRCGTGSRYPTRTSSSRSSRRASGARGATPAGTTPPTTSSTRSRA